MLKYTSFPSIFMQAQCQSQSLIHTTFSCIAYLRDLLDDSCFEDQMLDKTKIKKLIRTPKSQEILDLMEGMYEAIALRYLSKFEVALYLDGTKSSEIHESYTFEVTQGEKDEVDPGMIKKFCLMLQRLKPLPPSKFATIKLYYNETVPVDYNPRGFKDGEAHNFLYRNEKVKIECERRRVTPTEMYVREDRNVDGDVDRNVRDDMRDTMNNINMNNTNTSTFNVGRTQVRCSCEHDSDAFDLIQCDGCDRWLHTVCCGFFSNSDKRIPKGKYICTFCHGGPVNKRDSVMRKILSVVYNEGLRSKVWLTNRVGLYKGGFENYFRRLVEEGFMKTEGSGPTLKMVVVKNEKIKKKIKEYFKGKKRTSIPIRDLKMEM